MKPVIEKETHLNVIIMSDAGAAKTYRVSRGLLRFLVLFPVTLVLLSAGFIAAGVYFGADYLAMRSKNESQEKEISEMRLRLERLANLDTLLAPSPAPEAKDEEGGGEAPAESPAEELAQAPDAAAPAEEAAVPVPAEAPAEAAPESAESPAPAEPAAPADSVVAGLDFASIPRVASSASPVRISGFSGRPIGQQRVRIRYELSTSSNPDNKLISGQARHFALFTNGERAELPLPDNGETRFSITRMKPMEATARLPQGYDTKDIKQIDVVIITDDMGTFHDLFDVTHWRSY